MEGLQRIALLTHAEELDRLAGDMPHRKRRTTPGVAIDLVSTTPVRGSASPNARAVFAAS